MVIKLPRSRESTPVAVTPPSTTLDKQKCQTVLLTFNNKKPRKPFIINKTLELKVNVRQL